MTASNPILTRIWSGPWPHGQGAPIQGSGLARCAIIGHESAIGLLSARETVNVDAELATKAAIRTAAMTRMATDKKWQLRCHQSSPIYSAPVAPGSQATR
jgi:hypothetical protein